MTESPCELKLSDACAILAKADAHPQLASGIRLALQTIVNGTRAERGVAARAMRAFIDARVRARRIPASDAENIASDVELKLLERPELFLAAANPAAYIAISIRNRWLTQLRTRQREQRRAEKQARESAEQGKDEDEGDPLDPLAAEHVLREARQDLEVAAAAVVARAADEVREQQRETWRELVDLADKRVTMNDILRKHGAEPALNGLEPGGLEPENALKALRDRVLQRHQRMRKRMAVVVEELVADAAQQGWTPDRGHRAALALRQLFCRCQRKPTAASSGGGC